MWNLISDLITFKENSVKFFSSRIGLLNALERTQELSQKGFWIKEWRKPRLKFNIGLALLSLKTTGPRFTNYFPFHPSPLLWCRDHAKVKHIYFAIIIFFLTCFHMLRLHEKCFIICMLEVQKFVLVQILSLCQFVNNENIKNKIIWLNVGTSLVLQETPLKAAFKIPTWLEML